MDANNKRPPKLPHLAWSGPEPLGGEVEAYALAMVVRMAATQQRDGTKRSMVMAPSILSTKNLGIVSKLFAFYASHIRDEGIRSHQKLLEFMSESAKVDVWSWARDNKELVRRAEGELIDLVDTPRVNGFRVFG